MNHHIARWHSLTLSPADRAILDKMEEEMDTDTTFAEEAIAGDGPYWFPTDGARWLLEFCQINGMPQERAMELLEKVEDMCKAAESEGALNAGYD